MTTTPERPIEMKRSLWYCAAEDRTYEGLPDGTIRILEENDPAHINNPWRMKRHPEMRQKGTEFRDLAWTILFGIALIALVACLIAGMPGGKL